jgi:hypothetical protein
MAKKPPSILGQPCDGKPITESVARPYAEIMQDYGIDPDIPLFQRWRELAERLATEFHPKFRKPPGRPGHRSHAYYAMLIGSVRWTRENDELPSDKAALRYLYDNHPGLLVGTKREAVIPAFSSLEADLKTARTLVKSGNIDII